MCRSIRTLFNLDPPVTDEGMHAAARQFVRKVSSFTTPSRANEAAVATAVADIVRITDQLRGALAPPAAPRNRQVEAARAKARATQRRGTDPTQASDHGETAAAETC